MKEKGEKEYFFFSRKQWAFKARGAVTSNGIFKRNFCRLEDDRVMEYTEKSNSRNPKCRYNDVEYLGFGKHHHCYPERLTLDEVNKLAGKKKRQSKK